MNLHSRVYLHILWMKKFFVLCQQINTIAQRRSNIDHRYQSYINSELLYLLRRIFHNFCLLLRQALHSSLC